LTSRSRESKPIRLTQSTKPHRKVALPLLRQLANSPRGKPKRIRKLGNPPTPPLRKLDEQTKATAIRWQYPEDRTREA
jgi:hypothetical protein